MQMCKHSSEMHINKSIEEGIIFFGKKQVMGFVKQINKFTFYFKQ